MPIVDYLAKRPRVASDTECFPNLWMIGFRDVATKKVVKLMRTRTQELDRNRVANIFRTNRVYGFNFKRYDIPMILLAMTGATCEELKEANDRLIISKAQREAGEKALQPWEFMDIYNLKIPSFFDTIDLWDVMPSAAQKASLKKYAGMMHSENMMEFMHGFNDDLTDDEIQEAYDYLDNDLAVTCDAVEEMTPQIDIRSIISVDIGVDVRSMSDAQIGEAIMRQRVEKRKGGKKLYKPDIVPGKFKYEAPSYIEFQTPEMQAMFTRLLRSDFLVKRDGYVQLPEMFGKKKSKSRETVDDTEDYEGGTDIVFNGLPFKMGIGGLHSQEAAVSFYEDDDEIIVDIDVRGYYPKLIIKSKREPANMRGHFQPVYIEIVVERDAAKDRGDAAKAEQGKIATNGLFGKTGSPYSIVYDPKLMIQTTVTGQLSLLMLIEEFTLRGWRVISANTDGIVTKLPRKDLGMLRCVVWDWEEAAGLEMEYTFYRSIHSQSVNTYMAFKHAQDKKGNFTGQIEVKRKGKFALSGRGLKAAFGLKKTPHVEISYDAAVAFMLDGSSIESTVRNCQDIRKFVTVRQVDGGAEQNGVPIAKVVRYYYSVESEGPLNYISTGNRVPRSDGAQPLMRLPKELPCDIDYEFYEREAYAILHECGVAVQDPATKGRKGTYYGRREDQKTFHLINAKTAVAVCGVARKDWRDQWVERTTAPEGRAYCSKCRKWEAL